MTDQTQAAQEPEGEVLWPNQDEVVDGVVPAAEVPQDPNLFADEDLSFLDDGPVQP